MEEVNEYFEINGLRQSLMTLRTDDTNPVLLIVHGGAGCPDRVLVREYGKELADCYTVVCWDQRGCGYSYTKGPLTVDLLLSDLEAVAELLKEQYHQEQIYIAGHSWGSYLALRYAAAHPDNVRYYIGTGQEVSAIASGPDKYRFVKEQALKRNDKTVLRKLERFGEPDGNKYQTKDKKAGNYIWKKIFGYSGYFSKSGPSLPKYLTRYLRLYVRYYGLSTGKVLIGGIRSVLLLNAEMDLKDSLSGVTEVPFPVLLISGEEDMICPVPTARRWFDRLTAPKKEYVIIKNASHMVNFERPEEWNRLVLSLPRQEKKKAKHRGK